MCERLVTKFKDIKNLDEIQIEPRTSSIPLACI